jgi:hypothetical protein
LSVLDIIRIDAGDYFIEIQKVAPILIVQLISNTNE